jgi:hypothetical protein
MSRTISEATSGAGTNVRPASVEKGCVLHLHLHWYTVECFGLYHIAPVFDAQVQLALGVLHWCIFDWLIAWPSSSQLGVRRTQRECGTHWGGTKL